MSNNYTWPDVAMTAVTGVCVLAAIALGIWLGSGGRK
jgi:hypothetical protein